MQATLLSLLTLLIVSMAAAVIFDQIRKLVTAWIRQKDRRRLPYDIPDLFTASITDDAQAPVASLPCIPQASLVAETNLTYSNMNIMHSMFRTLRVTLAVILLTFVGTLTYAQTTCSPGLKPAPVKTAFERGG